MLSKALLVRLEALPRQEELADFLAQARSIVMEEPGTIAWFAIRFGPAAFGVYDVLPDDEARDAHLAGGVGQALGPNTGVPFTEPHIARVDILAGKAPASTWPEATRPVEKHPFTGCGDLGPREAWP